MAVNPLIFVSFSFWHAFCYILGKTDIQCPNKQEV